MKRGVIFGVFDLLHVGHLRVLESAKEHCDHLTVYIITDEVSQSYKRKPIIEESQRLELITALKVVDAAFLINHRSPVNLEDIDIYFVSERLKGEHHFYVPPQRLKDVVYLPYSEGINSTDLIKKCQRLA